MEKVGFKKLLSEFKGKGILPTQITTDRHTGIRKHLREEEPNIDHQFDVWHFVKNIKKRLTAAAKKACKILEKWIKSIGNHKTTTFFLCRDVSTKPTSSYGFQPRQ